MSHRREHVALVLMQTEVELSPVLHDGFVKRAQQHVVFIVQVGDREDQQTVVFARVAIDDGRAMVGARSVCAQNLTWQGFLQIYHQGFFKS